MIDESVDDAVTRAVTRLLEEREDREDWLTNEDAMRLLDRSRSTLARWRADGLLPYSKVGSAVYYRRSDVEELLEKGRGKGGT